MSSRRHVHEEAFAATPSRLFSLLHTPSAIRGWWGAARAVILSEPDGLWTAAWGKDEDAPDYLSVARISIFEPPRRMVLVDQRYRARGEPLPFPAQFTIDFTVEEHPEGASLRVVQEGFPHGPAGDDFLSACDQGWRETFAGIRRHLMRE